MSIVTPSTMKSTGVANVSDASVDAVNLGVRFRVYAVPDPVISHIYESLSTSPMFFHAINPT